MPYATYDPKGPGRIYEMRMPKDADIGDMHRALHAVSIPGPSYNPETQSLVIADADSSLEKRVRRFAKEWRVSGSWAGVKVEFPGKDEYMRYLREAEGGSLMTTNEELLEELKPQPGDDERMLAVKARLRKSIIEYPDIDDEKLLVEWTPERYAQVQGTAYISVKLPKRSKKREG